MGIDHGLGGRDSQKSKKRRELKAKKSKNIVVKLSGMTRKKEVIFDETARTEYLSGFHKRKVERRKYGLAMEILKKKKASREFQKMKRQTLNPKLEIDENESTDNITIDTPITNELKTTELFEDSSTREMFGSSVTVEIDSNEIMKANPSNILNNELIQSNRKAFIKHQPSRLEVALKKVGQNINQNKKRKPRNKKSQMIEESKKLFIKALNKAGSKQIKSIHSKKKQQKRR